MPLSGLAKLDRRSLLLLSRLFRSGLGKTRMLHDLQELHLVVRGMESAIQRQRFHLAIRELLEGLGLLHDHITVTFVAW